MSCQVDLQIETVPLPDEREFAWRQSVRDLFDWLEELSDGDGKHNSTHRGDIHSSGNELCDDHRGALLSVAENPS